MGWVFGLVAALGGGAFLFFRKGKSLSAVLPGGLLHVFTPSGTKPTLAAQVMQSGTAKPAAMALYNYLKATTAAPSVTLTNLVTAFQGAQNSDPNAVTLSGPLTVNGEYDNPTSAALTLYTHDPVPTYAPPAPSPPPPPEQVTNDAIPGSSATSAFNLYTYLKAHGNDRSADLAKFCKQFQLDFNTDPKGVGPASTIPVIKSQLATTGVYDAATATALAAYTNDKVSP